MKHIVCLGYAKCGTTMLDTVFRRSNLVATPRERKEIKFFLPQQYPSAHHHEAYLAQFFKNGVIPAGITHTFEASPPYCHQQSDEFRRVLSRIEQTLHEPRIVICVRHPVARAYSHYIHNLHSFALYGDGVYGKRNLLPQRVYKRSFEQALTVNPSIMTHYFEYLKMVYDVLGRDRVQLFFLESDTKDFRGWVSRLAGTEVASSLGLGEDGPSHVIPRRPVPNYVVKDEVLIAFGSREGELVRYAGLSHPERRAVLDSRKRWSLEINEGDVMRLTREHFAEDLERCAALTGDMRFKQYLVEQPEPQLASLAHGRLLAEFHRYS